MGWLEDEIGRGMARRVSAPTLRKRDGRWCAIVRVKRDDGTWTQRTHDTGIPCGDGDLRAKAERKALEWHDDILVGCVLDAVKRAIDLREQREALGAGGSNKLVMPFGEYAEEMLSLMQASKAIRPATVRGYRGEIRHMIAPRLGNKRMYEIKTADIEHVMVSLLDDGYSTSTVRKCVNLMTAVFRRAVEVDGLAKSPCYGVRAPSPAPPRQNAMTESGWSSLLEQLASMRQTPTVCAAELALLLGLTREETCALTWREWDAARDKGALKVSMAVVQGEHGYDLGEPKTTARVRTIPITKTVLAVGEARRTEAAREWSEQGAGAPRPSDYMIGHPDGSWFSPDALTRSWATLCSANGWVGERGERLTFHDLRHSFATRLVAAGADVKSASRILGHSTPVTTLKVYASEDQGAKRDAMDRIEGSLSGSVPAPTAGDAQILDAFARALRTAMGDMEGRA